MNITEMHYEFKLQANALDSQKTRNVLPAQIDWLINNASLIEAHKRITPYNQIGRGMEAIHKRTMDLAPLHIPAHREPALTPTLTTESFFGPIYTVDLADLQHRILYLTEAYATIDKSGCDSRLVGMDEMQTQDLGEALLSSTYKPSWKWRKVPFRIAGEGSDSSDPRVLYIYTNSEFTVSSIQIGYYKYPTAVFYGGYNSLDGTYTTSDSSVDSEFPSHLHRNIVDTAVQLFFADLQDAEYLQLKDQQNKQIEY